MGEAVIAAGIGCRKGAGAGAVEAAVAAALVARGVARTQLGVVATSESKLREPGIARAAERLGLPLLGFTEEALQAVEPAILTRSAPSLAATGVSSLSEAAALAAAGAGARLLGPRLTLGPVTCALAAGGGAP